MRFPGFEGEWDVRKLGDIAEVVGGGTPDTRAEEYWNGNIQWFTPSEIKSLFVSKSIRTITELGLKKSSAKLLPKGTILLTTRATIGDVAIAIEECSTNQGFQSLIINEKSNNIFVLNWILQNKNEFIKQAKGSTFAEISKKDVEKIILFAPSVTEQLKISSFLTLIDERISTQIKIIEDIKILKNGIRNILFKQTEKNSLDVKPVKDLIKYEQPTKYIVKNTNYSSNETLIPVLTANKAFILGYTNEENGVYNKGDCIILDDFTMDLKYVDFPFKVKSSAIKILQPKSNVNLGFIYEYFLFLNLQSSEHKRHYISEIEPMKIPLVDITKQEKIASLLFSIDKKLNIEESLLLAYHRQKKYLLQNLFI
ncbi:MAG: restriction endonuclease subunit S [Dysgonamonadaceae bacterium]|nr:restriction endonuclease subunit S [Dysgonamonadaceae bacterium]